MKLPEPMSWDRAEARKGKFDGKFIRGRGDVEYLRLLDIARRMFAPDPEYQNLSMLYCTNWNGFVEGPTWDAWWIQNSYGTTYAAFTVELASSGPHPSQQLTRTARLGQIVVGPQLQA